MVVHSPPASLRPWTLKPGQTIQPPEEMSLRHGYYLSTVCGTAVSRAQQNRQASPVALYPQPTPTKTPVSLNQSFGSLSSSFRTFFHVSRTSNLFIAFFLYLSSFVSMLSRCSLLLMAFFQRF